MKKKGYYLTLKKLIGSLEHNSKCFYKVTEWGSEWESNGAAKPSFALKYKPRKAIEES